MSLPLSEMRPPTGMPSSARRVFQAVTEALADRGDLYAEDRFTIQLYAESVAEAIAALRRGQGAPITKGSKEQDREGVGFETARRFMVEARAFGAELGLSPGARAAWKRKHPGGRPKGAVSAADRVGRQQLTVVQGGGA